MVQYYTESNVTNKWSKNGGWLISVGLLVMVFPFEHASSIPGLMEDVLLGDKRLPWKNLTGFLDFEKLVWYK